MTEQLDEVLDYKAVATFRLTIPKGFSGKTIARCIKDLEEEMSLLDDHMRPLIYILESNPQNFVLQCDLHIILGPRTIEGASKVSNRYMMKLAEKWPNEKITSRLVGEY